jgi:amino acid adenylation domain-containing protein
MDDCFAARADLIEHLQARRRGAEPPLDPDRPLAAQGFDSLAVVELHGELADLLDDAAPALEELFSDRPLRALLARAATPPPATPSSAAPAEDRAAGATATAAPAAEVPLTLGQQALWYLSRDDPASSAYHMVAAARCRGAVDPADLRSWLAALARRHAALRTVCAEHGGRPAGRLLADPAAVVEVAAAAGGASEAEALRRLHDELYRPFDLARGPLLRAVLVTRSGGEPLLGLAVHHAVADFTSAAVLLADLGELRRAAAAREPPRLAPLAADPAAPARWEREWLASAACDAALDWWRATLAGSPAALALPTDRPRPVVPTTAGAAVRLRFPAGLPGRLFGMARAAGASPFACLAAAWRTLLARLAGERDLIIGTPASHRARPAFAGLVGYLVNPLPLRLDAGSAGSFAALVAAEQAVVAGALAHRAVPFPLLVERLQPERVPGRPPIFQTMIVYHREPAPAAAGAGDGTAALPLAALALGEPDAALDLGGLLLRSLAIERRGAQLDLSLTLAEFADGLGACLDYSTEIFDESTARRLLQALVALLAAAATDVARPPAALPLLAAAELEELVAVPNRTVMPLPAGLTAVDALVAYRAGREPDRIAVVDGTLALSHAELAALAGRLAAHLRARGVGPETLVGVCLPRDARLVVALLAVLQAGGAYLPLDPAQPPERLRLMVEDARPLLVLAATATRAVADPLGAPVLDLDAGPAATLPGAPVLDLGAGPAATLPGAPVLDLGAGPVAERLAYVIYTSGSTGRPKGVGIPHAAAVNFLSWAGRTVTAAEWDATLASTSIGFDLSVFEIFGPLAAGGTVVLAPGPLYATDLPAAAALTLLNTVPGAMAALVANRAVPPAVHTVALAGEALDADLAAAITTGTTPRRLLNLYGPTEATTYATWAEVTAGGLGPPPIGQPIGNTRAYVVDAHLALVPPAFPGELLLGGRGLARGYLGQPGLTAERFVPDPWSGEPGARLYRTGDRVRWRADWQLDFLGRFDDQVKVRGHRVEPGEVEHALRACPGIAEAAVVVRPAQGALDACLVADGPSPAPALLRDLLRRRLPEAMVPARFVFVAALPRTPNGKLDRRALAALAAAAPVLPAAAGGPAGVPPASQATPVEEVLAAIWQGLLGIPAVGADDDFMALGGHSLLATQAVARIRETLGVELPVRALLTTPTLAGVARLVDAARGAAAPPRLPLPPLIATPRGATAPLSFAQQSLWLFSLREPASAAYNVCEALRLAGPLDAGRLRRAFTAVACRHEAMRTTFAARGDEPLQVVAPGAPVALPLVDLGALPAARREGELLRLAHQAARQPFDLAHGPLLRLCLLRLAGDDHALLVGLHHIVCDGWSTALLAGEVGAHYAAAAAAAAGATALPLPPLPVQYADFALWQRAWLGGAALAEQLDYWRGALAGVPELLTLPTDRPRPPGQSFRGALLVAELPAALAAALRERGRCDGLTLFMVGLAAFAALLGRYSGQRRLAIGTPIANRRLRQLEPLIGFFANTLVLAADVAVPPTFAELAAQVRETCLDAYSHQDLPFDKLVEALQPERSLAWSPLVQALFVLHNAPPAALVLPGVAVRRLAIESGTAKFDLSLALREPADAEPGTGAAGLEIEIEYATDLFDRATIRRLLGHYQRLLAAAVEHPAAPLAALPLLAPAEAAQVLREWNDAADEPTAHGLVHRLVEAQAVRTPGARAASFAGASLTYDELNRRANQLADHLGRLGVGLADRVGVCAERSLDLPVALLATLKAGAVYVPLDAEYPPERLLYILRDAGVGVVLTQQGLQNLFAGQDVRLVYLDMDGDALFTGAGRDVDRGVHPEMPGYLLYTSGSTGRPKGALLPHRGIANHAQWKQRTFPLSSADRVLQKTRIGFDASLWEFFYAWTAGADLVLARPGGHRDNAYLAHLIASEAVTVFQFVPSAAFVGSLARGYAIFAGGEAPICCAGCGPPSASMQLLGGAPRRRDRDRADRPADRQRPALDAAGQVVPAGVAGELPQPTWRPDRRALRAAPLCRHGERLELVRSADGQLDLDDQVKIRGFRIEPGEIEAALGEHPAVAASVVVPRREEAPGELLLVAYVVAAPGRALDPSELRDVLRRRLPEHMVPAAFVVLDALPLSANGKVDRAALPAPQREASPAEHAHLAPRDPIEEVLAGIWCQVLGLPRVGRDDNFFDLGGHSLLATQVNSRIAQAFQAELALEELFAAPTLAGLAQSVRVAVAGGAPSPPPLLAGCGVAGETSFAQQRLWIVQQLESDDSVYNNPALLRIRGPLDVAALAAALAEIARRHAVLRTTFEAVDGLPRAVVAPPGRVDLAVVDLGAVAAAPAAAERWLTVLARRPFDLAAGPLWRTTLLRLAAEEHLLLLNLHHIVSTAGRWGSWSARSPPSTRRPRTPPVAACRPAGPVRRLRLLAARLAGRRGPRLAGAWWKSRLAGAAAGLELPLDRPRPRRQTFAARSPLRAPGRADGGSAAREPAPGGDALHDAAGGLERSSAATAGSTTSASARRSPAAPRVEIEPSSASSSTPSRSASTGWRPRTSRAGGPRAHSRPRRLRPPGHAVRAPDRRAAAGAQPEHDAALPSHVRPAEYRLARRAARGRPGARLRAPAQHACQVRSHPGARRRCGRPRRLARIQPRSLRRRDSRAADPPPARRHGRCRGRPLAAVDRLAASRRGRARRAPRLPARCPSSGGPRRRGTGAVRGAIAAQAARTRGAGGGRGRRAR